MPKPRAIRSTAVLNAVVVLAATYLPVRYSVPQTLARPGWVGSGLTAQSWFKRAIFYQIDPRTFDSSSSDSHPGGSGDLKGVTRHLGYIHSLGVDGILLRPLTPPQAGGSVTQAGSAPGPPDPALAALDLALGSVDDFDDLTLQASRLKIRILLELPTPDPGAARFWLARGVAGFYIPGNASTNGSAIQAIRKLLISYAGQRVLITDADLGGPSLPKPLPNELVLDRAVLKGSSPESQAPGKVSDLVTGLRAALESSQALLRSANPILATNGSSDPRLAQIIATVTLLNRSASLVAAGQELGVSAAAANSSALPWGQAPAAVAEEGTESPRSAKPAAPVAAAPDKYAPYVPYARPVAAKQPTPPDPATAAGQEVIQSSLLNLYRQLSLLHHGNGAIQDGEEITLNHDGESALVWVRKPPSPSRFNPAIVIACNLSDKPLLLSLRPEIMRLQLRGNFLRTLVRSDDAMGGTSIDHLTVPPYGVYVGELRY